MGDNNKGLFQKSMPLNFIFYQLNYILEAKNNKWFTAEFADPKIKSFFSSKYILKFPVFTFKFIDFNDVEQDHIVFVSSGDDTTFADNYTARYCRTIVNRQSRLESYKNLGSLKGYFGKRVDCDKTADLINKIKDSRTIKEKENKILKFAVVFTRLIKVLNYLPESLLSVVQYTSRMQLRCLPTGSYSSTSPDNYKLIIDLDELGMSLNFINAEGERVKTDAINYDNVHELNKAFELIRKLLQFYKIDVPFDMDYLEEEEF